MDQTDLPTPCRSRTRLMGLIPTPTPGLICVLLLPGPRCMPADAVIILHGVNGALDLFVITKHDGSLVASITPTKVCLRSIMEATDIDLRGLSDTDPVAFYDAKVCAGHPCTQGAVNMLDAADDKQWSPWMLAGRNGLS